MEKLEIEVNFWWIIFIVFDYLSAHLRKSKNGKLIIIGFWLIALDFFKFKRLLYLRVIPQAKYLLNILLMTISISWLSFMAKNLKNQKSLPLVLIIILTWQLLKLWNALKYEIRNKLEYLKNGTRVFHETEKFLNVPQTK